MRFIDLTLEPDPAQRSKSAQRLAESDAIIREELLNWRMSQNFVLNLLSFVHGDPDTFRAIHAESDDVAACEVHPVADERFYAYLQQTGDHGTTWWTAFLTHDFIHVPPVVFEDDTVGLTILGEFDALQDVIEDLSAEVTINVESIGDYHGQGQRVTDRLTTRQYRALRIAAECGYYDVPRDGSLADVANVLDCTESTASDLLRRAEREVIHAILTA